MENTHKRFNFITWFREMWTSHPLFSTTCALLLMIILQTAALGFDQGSFGEWFSIWSRNWINILRNNATIGIIALGMTFVIITGGIDLAVGSTLVAIGAIVMIFIDSSQTGLLTQIGITGVPAAIVGILMGIIAGFLLGECPTFRDDAAAIRRCEVLVLLFYGLYSDSGTAWECGYGYALGKRIVAVHLHEGKSNCMINCSCRANVRGLDGLRAYDFCALPPINYYE